MSFFSRLFTRTTKELPDAGYEIQDDIIKQSFEWMNWEDRVRVKKASLNLQQLLSGSSFRSKSDMVSFYTTSATVYTCVYAISKAISQATPTLKIKKDGKMVSAPDSSKAVKFLENPNPWLTWREIIESNVSMIELSGETFNEKVVPEGSPLAIQAIWPLRTDLSEVFFDDNGIPHRLRVNQGQNTSGGRHLNVDLIWDKGEFTCFKYFNPSDFTKGQSALSTLFRQVFIQKHSDIFTQAFFQNGAKISGLLKPTGTDRIGKEEREALEKQFNNQYAGSTKAHKTAIMGGPWDFQQVSVNPKDTDMEIIKRFSRDDILSAFGVQPVVAGYLDGATYSNANIQRSLFYRQTIVPKAKKLDAWWTKQVFQLLDENVFYQSDFSDVKELQEDKKANAEVEKIMSDAGTRTINEIREFQGLNPLEGPDAEKGERLPVKSAPKPEQAKEELEDSLTKSLEQKTKEIELKILAKGR